ncbi:MAG: oligoendopeptidase F, partial [Firmicutes bacterium]|nr:oligoendopeptidase F [Bacillota bacterium]
RFALSRPSEEQLKEHGLLPYKYMIEESLRLAHHRPEPEVWDLLLGKREKGSKVWAELRNTLDAKAEVKVPLPDGEKILSLAQARALQSSKDPEIRRIAYEAEIKSYPSWEGPMADCINGIKGEAIEELGPKKYASVRDEMLDINKMSQATLDALNESIEAHLPALRDYLKAKAQILGHKDGLPWYDLSAPLSSEENDISFDTAHDMVMEALGNFSGELGELAERAFDSRWIDALPRKGKYSGGICYDIPSLRENRIIVNYNGTLHDVLTIAHELGHAYHNRQLDGVPFILRDVPTPICETASLFNETIVSEALRREKIDTVNLLDTELTEAVQTVMDIYSRYLFEDAFLNERASHRLDPSEICSLMVKAQRRVFGDALDASHLHPYMWMNKVHYYIPGFHYYSYPYYFGMLLSKGLYSNYLKDKEHFPLRYKSFLEVSCSASLEDVASFAGSDVTSTEFWDSALSQIDAKCEEFCSKAL